MFLFQKSVIGAYCNRLYDLEEGMAPFDAMVELKQTAQVKILMSEISIQKRGYQIVKHAHH